MDYARAYFEQAQINAGPAMLVWIVQEMALSMVPRGRGGPRLDPIAIGFLNGIGKLLQRGIGLAALSAVALGAGGRRPSKRLGNHLSKLFTTPGASFDIRSPQASEPAAKR